MFEDSLVESSGRIKTKSKYWTILTTTFVCSVVFIMYLIPLINPEALPLTAMMAGIVALTTTISAVTMPLLLWLLGLV